MLLSRYKINKKGCVIIMTMGDIIRIKRNELGLSQEELGEKLDPKVNRAAVNKWETGLVENIKRSHIGQLSKIFEITPTELMCFDYKFDVVKISEEVKTIELVEKDYGKDVTKMIELFQELNEEGKKKVLNDLSDLTDIPKYTEKRDCELKHA